MSRTPEAQSVEREAFMAGFEAATRYMYHPVDASERDREADWQAHLRHTGQPKRTAEVES